MRRSLFRRRGAFRVKDHVPVFTDRRAQEDADEFERKANLLAPRVGFCGYCGKIVDEPAGKLHGHDCSVAEERRHPKGYEEAKPMK